MVRAANNAMLSTKNCELFVIVDSAFQGKVTVSSKGTLEKENANKSKST